MNILTEITKNDNWDFGTGLIFSLIAIGLVFLVLLIIIVVMEVIFRGEGWLAKKFKKKKLTTQEVASPEAPKLSVSNVDLASDEDANVALLVSSIDYRQEIKEDVKLVSIRKIEE